MNPLLSVRDLTIDFRQGNSWHRVVDRLSFEIQPGEIVGIVGQSGSGKTVSCRSVIQLLPPRTSRVAGQVFFGGTDLLKLDSHGMGQVRGEQIAMIFQNPGSHLNPLMRVGDQIAEAPIVHRRQTSVDARHRAIELLERVGIPDPERNANSFPHQFSGGMRQRVMIAAALACQPSLLIADEPTTALDVTVQAKVLDLLCQLQRDDNLAILLVSHDLGVIAERCDRVLVMFQGKLVEAGSTKELMHGAQQPYTRKLILSQPALAEPGKPFPGIDEGFEIHNASTSNKDSVVVREESPDLTTPAELLVVNQLHIRFRRSSGLVGSILRRSTPDINAVDGINLVVNRGDSLGIVGESGSGKSTFARALVNLIRPNGGSIHFNGRDLSTLDAAQRHAHCRQVQMIFQDPLLSLNPKMTVGATLSEALGTHQMCSAHETTNRVKSLMHQVGLPAELVSRRPHQLSGGQCQRVGIARALSVNPQMIIADEATSALDVTIQAQILNLLMRLCRQMRVTLIFISHDLSVVRHLCSTVAVMQFGRIVEQGAVEQIFDNPQNPYTRQLIEAIPALG